MVIDTVIYMVICMVIFKVIYMVKYVVIYMVHNINGDIYGNIYGDIWYYASNSILKPPSFRSTLPLLQPHQCQKRIFKKKERRISAIICWYINRIKRRYFNPSQIQTPLEQECHGQKQNNQIVLYQLIMCSFKFAYLY